MTPVRRWERADVAAAWPVPGAADDKYSRGVVGVIAGSEAYPGAAALVVSGAVRAGAGMVRYVGPERAQDLVLAHRPEAVIHHPVDVAERLPRAQAWVVGPGVSDYPEQDAAIGAVVAESAPMVVDAGALETVARARAAGVRAVGAERVLLTPHAGELVRTLEALRHDVTAADVERDRVGHARLLAETARATVLLKGAVTLIVSPGGATIELPEAPAWLATAGAGDVLAGIAGALLAADLTADVAGACAAWVHARAAERASGGGPVAALDVAGAAPAVVAALLRS
ncbi:NAD(P)H-hydrate dehydratase [Demequina sp. SYSU T00192]|uniref:ADP-dependent (S)-NAD(P)H-hydrate dehydratase n=1 Tax=Demequina litoralis TaxID=3051660 RepID=A0ABT8GCH2_9MICO|nr:NAD(P)H-hydrate dehydratase [Demequina sp. SYSU T00192]MDN4476828.1 NAD(P)H-hydrate dehydratase [Demequina sp. SYSU T00192]